MGKKHKKNRNNRKKAGKRKKKRNGEPDVQVASAPLPAGYEAYASSLNLVARGCRGCYIADEESDWIIGARTGSDATESPAAADEMDIEADGDELVDIEFIDDDQSGTAILTVQNLHRAQTRVAYVSVSAPSGDPAKMTLLDRHMQPLVHGLTSHPDLQDALEPEAGAAGDAFLAALGAAAGSGPLLPCVTFVLILKPRTTLFLARLAGEVELHKLTFELKTHPAAAEGPRPGGRLSWGGASLIWGIPPPSWRRGTPPASWRRVIRRLAATHRTRCRLRARVVRDAQRQRRRKYQPAFVLTKR